MTGTFGGLSTALSALYAQRRGLEVAGQNIANANTEGYSRQRLGMAAVGAPAMPAIFAVGDPAGSGVKLTELVRFRDEFLETRARTERASNAYMTDKKGIYTRIEQVIGEPSDTGIQSQLAEYWSAWHDVANRPGDAAARTQLLQRGTTLVDSINNTYRGLSSLWDSTREQINTYVKEVNTTAATVAQLNEAVVRTKQAGLPGNELSDQRDQAVLRLAELTGGTVIAKDDGVVDVSIFGSSIVAGTRARQLTVVGATALADQAADPVEIRWLDSNGDPGSLASIPSGRLAATLETLNATLPDLVKSTTSTSLDSVVENLVTSVNDLHTAGYDLNGNPGQPFFSGTTAATLKVAISSPDQVAASLTAPPPPPDPPITTYDGRNADRISALPLTANGPDSAYRQFVVDLGVAAQSVYRRAEIQGSITQDIDAARTAESGVNLDEEMMSLVAHQRAYEAAAKLMSVIDASLDALINSLRR